MLIQERHVSKHGQRDSTELTCCKTQRSIEREAKFPEGIDTLKVGIHLLLFFWCFLSTIKQCGITLECYSGSSSGSSDIYWLLYLDFLLKLGFDYIPRSTVQIILLQIHIFTPDPLPQQLHWRLNAFFKGSLTESSVQGIEGSSLTLFYFQESIYLFFKSVTKAIFHTLVLTETMLPLFDSLKIIGLPLIQGTLHPGVLCPLERLEILEVPVNNARIRHPNSTFNKTFNNLPMIQQLPSQTQTLSAVCHRQFGS